MKQKLAIFDFIWNASYIGFCHILSSYLWCYVLWYVKINISNIFEVRIAKLCLLTNLGELPIWVGAYWFSATLFSKWPPGGHIRFSVSGLCRWHGFQSVSQVCFGISISNFIYMLMVVIGRSLLIFSDVAFKMAAWWPYWIFWFPDSNFSLTLNINSKLK